MLTSSNTLPMTSEQSSVGSGTTRTVAVASGDAAVPSCGANTWARLTYWPSLTPEPTISISWIVRLVLVASSRLAQVSWLPATVGSTLWPSTRPDPGTYLKPPGKVSITLSRVSGAAIVLVTVIVYGTSWPRGTFCSAVTLVMLTALPRRGSIAMWLL